MEKRTLLPENPSMGELYGDRLHSIFTFYADNNVDARLVGSFGRAAAMHAQPTSFRAENGDNKDIDICILNLDDDNYNDVINESAKIASPYVLEGHFRNQIYQHDGNARIRYKDLVLDVNPIIFNKQIGNLLGVNIPTFLPQTHFHMTALYGFMRPKDFVYLLKYRRELDRREDLLDESLFDPFHELNRIRSKEYPADELMGKARWLYHRSLSPKMRSRIAPLTTNVWHAIKGM